MAVPSAGDRTCVAASAEPQSKTADIAVHVNPPPSTRTPADCLAFIAGKTSSTATLTRCLRQSAPHPAVTPTVFSQVSVKLQPAALPQLRGACRDGGARNDGRIAVN